MSIYLISLLLLFDLIPMSDIAYTLMLQTFNPVDKRWSLHLVELYLSQSPISGEDEYHNPGHSSCAKWEHFSRTTGSLSGLIEYWAAGQKISNKNLHSLRWIFLSQKELCNFSKVLVTTLDRRKLLIHTPSHSTPPYTAVYGQTIQ